MPIPLAFTKLLRSFESCAEAVEKLVIFRKGYHQIYVCNFSFTATPEQSCKNVISNPISDGKPPQMKILNMIIPILMRFYSLVSNWSITSCIKPYKGICQSKKCDIINDISITQDILSQIFDVIQSNFVLQKQRHADNWLFLQYIKLFSITTRVKKIRCLNIYMEES